MEEKGKEYAFSKQNYKLLLIGLVVVAIGFILMMGGGSEDPNEFNEDVINFRRITLAPLFVITGYGFVLYAILKKTTSK